MWVVVVGNGYCAITVYVRCGKARRVGDSQHIDMFRHNAPGNTTEA